MDRLLRDFDLVETTGDLSAVEVTAVECDSRLVRPGALFCCVPGRLHDGHDFALSATEAGGVGLLVERVLPLAAAQAVVRPGTMRAVMARVARAVHGDPSASLRVVGVTGTNGKTTVSHLVAAILQAHGEPCSVIGTLSGARTTPESPVLQRLLAEARDAGRAAVSMEVSSHALAEHRVDAVHFAAAVFTNLGHDHLDYHETMEAYFEAKASLFEPGRSEVGVVNVDDQWGARLLERCRIPTVPFRSSEVSDVELSPRGSAFTWRGRRVRLRLPGAFHVVNALAAATTASALGVPEETVVEGLGTAAPVPGRFEVVPADAPFAVVVDYAHTPDALAKALSSARSLVGPHRVLCVFGCGGDRDRAKRPAMGRVAAEGSDVVVVTSDNSRSEEPMAVIADILAGIECRDGVTVEPDRRAAIALAIGQAQPGDVVLVAGKGHETTIDVGGRQLPFDDRLVAAELLAARSGARP